MNASSVDTLPLPCGNRLTLYGLLFYFLKLGALGFGGPIALAAYMQRDLVETRAWVTRSDYTEGLAFSQLCPGPLAAQLAMYLGWVCRGTLGATLAGGALVLPSFVMVIVLAALYTHYGQLAWIQGLFYGVGAAVIAVIVQSACKLVRLVLGRDPLLWALFLALAVTTASTGREIVWLFVLSGVFVMLVKAPPTSPLGTPPLGAWAGFAPLLTGVQGGASAANLSSLFLFFLKAGAFVFGSGLAIVPFLYGGAVVEFHWLSERQFLDAVAVAMITPGPVVITAGFIGYLVGGLTGALIAAAAVFSPPYLFVIAGAPYYRRFARNPQVTAFVQGVTAAAVGAIAGAAFILGRKALVDSPTALIAVATLVSLLFAKKVPVPVLILVAGLAGCLLFPSP